MTDEPLKAIEDTTKEKAPPLVALAPGELATEIPPIVQKRIVVHNDDRIKPLTEELRTNSVIKNRLLLVEEMCSQAKEKVQQEIDQMRKNMEEERARFKEEISMAERKLRETNDEVRASEQRLAEMEKREKLFAEEHERHDPALKALIEENRTLAAEQLEIIDRILKKGIF